MDPDSKPPEPNTPPTLEAQPDGNAERQARLDYYKSVAPANKKHRTMKIISAVVVLLLILGAGYWHFVVDKPVAKPTPITQHQAKSQAESAANQKVATKSYSSTNFQVNMNYPATWTYQDTPTDLSVTSPAMSLTDATGAKVNGKIVMNMVPKGTIPAAFGSGATAVLNSVNVDYTEPTPAQRASTYLSFVQYQATTTAGALDGIYVTGNYGYQKDQNIPATDIANVDPLITVTFEKCADTTCNTNLTPLSIASTDWKDSSISAPITTLLTSLAFN